MKKYGQLNTACCEWRFKTTALKTWELCVKHFNNQIDDLDTHATAEIQGYHVTNSSKMEAALNAATSDLLDKQVQMANLARQSNNNPNAMSEMIYSRTSGNAKHRTIRGTKKN